MSHDGAARCSKDLAPVGLAALDLPHLDSSPAIEPRSKCQGSNDAFAERYAAFLTGALNRRIKCFDTSEIISLLIALGNPDSATLLHASGNENLSM